MTIRLLTGDCRDVLATLPDASLDSCATDPPYHLTSGNASVDWGTFKTDKGATNNLGRGHRTGFMGQTWDGGDVAFRPETWAAVLRVLKPGAHLLAFGGTRTFHRLVCAVEDAGFEIRDCICWHYASGFPKSLDVSKAIDKAAGAEREVIGQHTQGFRAEGSGIDGWRRQAHAVHGSITAPATPEAAAWQGWGTAIKPSTELICLARKPLERGLTVAANVLKWGTGALNIDACRVETEGRPLIASAPKNGEFRGSFREGSAADGSTTLGRWPANLVLSYPEDEYELRADVTPDQRRELFGWLHENA